ncbi:hypothetical protein JCM8547_001977 [Rhodosporidiobolus lusitaniae]
MSDSDEQNFEPATVEDYWGDRPAGQPPRPAVSARKGGRSAWRGGGPAAPAPSSAGPRTKVKGKGKEKVKLEDVDAEQAGQRVEENALPVDDLSPALKLIKATQLLSNAFLAGRTAPGDSATLSLTMYTDVVRLLTGTLADLNALPLRFADPTMGEKIVQDFFETGKLKITKKLLRFPVFSSVDEMEIGDLFLQNARLALAALEPDLLKPAEASASTPTSQKQGPLRSIPTYVDALPAEILILIFSYARKLASSQPPSVPPPSTDAYDAQAYGPSNDNLQEVAQRFVLALGLVCKNWLKPARAVAMQKLFAHRGQALVKLNSLLSSSESSISAQQISSLDVLLVPTSASASASSSASAAPFERNSGQQFESLVAKTGPGLSELKLTIKNPRHGAGGGGPMGFLRAALASAGPRDFLETSVFNALTSLPSLRHLTLTFTIDFEELESVFLASPSLETVSLSSVENLTHTAVIHSPTPHSASRIRSFTLGDTKAYYTPALASLTPQQLVWLLEPSVASLREIEVTCITDGPFRGPPGIPGQGGGGGGGGAAPPFASGEFADLLVRVGAGLVSLKLTELGVLGTNLSLTQPPHLTSFTHALSYLPSLRTLRLPGLFTGPSNSSSFLPTLTSTCVSLESLTFLGYPLDVSPSAVAQALEGGEWPRLEKVRVKPVKGGGFGAGAGGGGGGGAGGQGGAAVWTGPERRAVEEAARRRWVEFGTK